MEKYGARTKKCRPVKKSNNKKKDGDDCNKDSDNKDKGGDEHENAVIKSLEELHLVVATLIATVTFAAGFTLPGGTIQEGEHQGTPILKHNPAFQAFIVTDTIAMVLSSTAVLIHLLLPLSPWKSSKVNFLFAAFIFTVVAIASMMIAFVTGTYATLGVSSGLGIVILLIGLSFFVPCFFSFYKFVDQ